MKRELRAKRQAVQKREFSGRVLRTEVSDDGSRYKYLHATKGWRSRASGSPDAKPRYEALLAGLFRRSVMRGQA